MAQDDLDVGLLDFDLEEIDDLPGFEVPATGEYIFKLTTELKKVNDNTCVQTQYEVITCEKKDNDSDPDPVPGTKFSNLYTIISKNTDPEKKLEAERMGKGKLKELLKGVSEKTGQGNVAILVRDVIASCTVRATLKKRQDKEDKERFFPIIKNLELA